MKVNKIKIQNIMAIEEMDVDFKGCSVLVTAGNNQGKSTLLKSLPQRLAGTKATIKNGETNGFCEWELSTGDRFTWELREGKDDKLRFITKDNIRTSVTKEISNRFFPAQFDVDKFLTLSKNKKKEEIEKLSGIDTKELNRKYEEAYSNRTYVNRVLKDSEALNFNFDRNIPEKVDKREEELTEVISKVDVKNVQIENIVKGVKEKSERIAIIKEELAKLEKEVKDGNKWLETNKIVDKADKVAELDSIKKVNLSIVENNLKRENYKTVVKNRETAEEADKLVKSIVTERHELVAQSKMPEGFSFDDSGDLLYNGFPFDKDNLSSSALYIAALKLAVLSLGEVRAIHFDASFLDKFSLKEIQEWAETQDLQLLIERPDFDGSEEIIYEFLS